ncbi:MAG: T9SS type A sorting domain-containing protein, partial [FCB group bacterium]
TIDSVYYFSGDSSSFIINLQTLRHFILNPLVGDSVYNSAIAFVPKSIGQHDLILEILSDAAPDYQRVKSYIHISGFCFTLESTLNVDIPPTILPCNKDKAFLNIKNTGNKELFLQTLDLDNAGLNVNWANPPNLPLVILPDSSIKLEIDYYLVMLDSGTIKIHLVFNDTINRYIEFYLAPIKSYVTIQKINDFEVTPGDTINTMFNGIIPYKADSLVQFSLRLDVEEKNLFLVKENLNLILKNSKGQILIPINVSQNYDQVLITCKNKLSISEETDWSVNLKFFVLLSDEQGYTLKAYAQSVPCCIGDSMDVAINLSNVCNLPARTVSFRETSVPEIIISPVPAVENLNVDMKIPYDDWVNLSVYDIFGKKIEEYLNLYLKKGTYSLIFEIEHFADGIYFLSFSNSQMKKNIIFIKTK